RAEAGMRGWAGPPAESRSSFSSYEVPLKTNSLHHASLIQAGRWLCSIGCPRPQLLKTARDLIGQNRAMAVVLHVLLDKQAARSGGFGKQRVHGRYVRGNQRVVGCMNGKHWVKQFSRRRVPRAHVLGRAWIGRVTLHSVVQSILIAARRFINRVAIIKRIAAAALLKIF